MTSPSSDRYQINLTLDELYTLCSGLDRSLSDTDLVNSLIQRFQQMQPVTRQSGEPLTAAYLALGAQESKRFGEVAARCGELELVDQVIGYAGELDTLFDQLNADDGYSGIFCYDVAEPLGTWIVDHNEGGLSFPDRKTILGRAAELIAKNMESSLIL